jgi:hypothetical protein
MWDELASPRDACLALHGFCPHMHPPSQIDGDAVVLLFFENKIMVKTPPLPCGLSQRQYVRSRRQTSEKAQKK